MKSSYWTRWHRQRIARRRMLQGSAAAGLGGAGFVLVGCGDDDDAPDATTEPTQGGNGDDPTATSAPDGGSPTEAPPSVSGEGWEWIHNEPDFSLAPQRGGTLRYGTPIRAPSLDPVASASFESAAIYTPVYSRLLRGKYGSEMNPFNPWTLEVTGDLAESWEQQDDGSYTFSIRQGVSYQDVPPADGRPLTAEDIAFSLQSYVSNPEFEDLLPFDSIEAVDDSTVNVTLNREANYVIEGLTENRVVMLSPELADADGDFAQRAIGTGPFTLDEYEAGTRARYSRNPNYWHPDYPYIDAIEFDALNDRAAARAAYIAGNYDTTREGISGLDEIDPTLSGAPDSVVLRLDSRWQSNIFNFGLRADVEPFNDPRVRTALSKAFNREQFGDLSFGGDYNVLGSYPWTGWFDSEPDLGDPYVYDPAAARAMLDQAGVEDLNITVEFFPYSQNLSDQLQFMQEQYREINVTLDLQSLEYTTFQALYFAGEFQQATVGFVPTFPRWQPLSMRVLWHSESPKNYYHLGDAALDSALETVVTTMDPEEQRQAYQEAWTNLMTTPQYLQFVEGPTLYTHSPRLHGFLHNMFNDWGGWGYQAMESFWLDS